MRGLICSIVAALSLCAALAGPAFAFRTFPADAARGHFSVVQFPVVTLGHRTMNLAPGAQIRDTTNLIVMPTSLSGTYRAAYTLDRNGQVFRVWLLTDDEWWWLRSHGQ